MQKSKAAYRHTMVKGMTFRGKPQPPPPAAMLEAKRAQERAALDPLAYVFGDPLPGRSALDKMKKESRNAG